MPVNSMSRRFCTGMVQGIGQAGKLQSFVYLANQFFVGHSRTPLFTWFEHDRRVIRVYWSVVGRAVGAAHGTKDSLYFREGFNDSVLLLKERGGLSDGDSRKGVGM